MSEFVAVDLETTGFDPNWDRVIEVGAVAFTTEAVLDRMESLADPGRSVPQAVLKLTGIPLSELKGSPRSDVVMKRLADFVQSRQILGHGVNLDLDFMLASGLWKPGLEVIDTLHVARILLPDAASHSLPLLAAELGLEQPRPHRALDDADATRQLFLRLREEAAALDETLKEAIVALVAPYDWAISRFFTEALTALAPLSRLPVKTAADRRPAGRSAEIPHTDDPKALIDLLAPGGFLARAFPGYEHRESQLQMALAVAQIFRRGGVLAVEAGTGTGKSLAYLVPAIGRALATGERVVVSTHTHTLQEQLMTKDIPGLREWLPWEFDACLLKGRANYVSLRRWRRYLSEPCGDAEELRFKLKILVWLQRTDTGDRSELRLQGREEVLWARIASDPLDCVGIYCTSEDCYVHRARSEAESAEIVVVNHALVLADAAQGGGVLPPFQHLIVDEAHHLEDAATGSLRQEVDGAGLAALLDRLSTPGADRRSNGLLQHLLQAPPLGMDLEEINLAVGNASASRGRVESLFLTATDLVEKVLTEGGRRDESVRVTPQIRALPAWEGLAAAGEDAVTALSALDGGLRRAVSGGRDWQVGTEPDPVLREVEIIRGRLADATRLLAEVFSAPDANRVYWFTLPNRATALAIRSAPLNVGSLLREHVFDHLSTLVLTSASLQVGGSFDYFRERIGLQKEPETLVLDSPFDYLRQALVCVPRDVPDPEAEEFDGILEEAVADICRRLAGRTLVLFTSHRQLRETCIALKQRSDLDDLLILGQSIDGPRRQVLAAFTDAERAVLLGTSSFWEGIDVPGDRLSCVIMVRLPFPVPSEPVFAARSETMREPFTGYALPLAALRLKQGFGRLIRRHTDRGAVVLLDRRISSREYGQAFLRVLPPASMFTGPIGELGQRIEDWVGSGSRVQS